VTIASGNDGYAMTQDMTQSGAEARLPSVGRWIIAMIPSGWLFMPNFGIRQMSVRADVIVANICLGQDQLESADGCVSYIEKQKSLIGGHLKGVKFAGPNATPFGGADEAKLLVVRHAVEPAGSLLHVQTYVRLGRWLGIITLTVQEAGLKEVRPGYDAFLKSLRIGPDRAAQPNAASDHEPKFERV
jgi:hypothetical protein